MPKRTSPFITAGFYKVRCFAFLAFLIQRGIHNSVHYIHRSYTASQRFKLARLLGVVTSIASWSNYNRVIWLSLPTVHFRRGLLPVSCDIPLRLFAGLCGCPYSGRSHQGENNTLRHFSMTYDLRSDWGESQRRPLTATGQILLSMALFGENAKGPGPPKHTLVII
jgi:hypothetical protein